MREGSVVGGEWNYLPCCSQMLQQQSRLLWNDKFQDGVTGYQPALAFHQHYCKLRLGATREEQSSSGSEHTY